MDAGFWLGVALAIPLGIVTNLITPRIQQRFIRRGSRKAEKAKALENEHNKQAQRLASDPVAYQSFFYRSLLRAAGGAFGVLVSLFLLSYGTASSSLFGTTPGAYNSILFIVIPLGTAVVGINFAVREALDAYIMTELVDKFRGEAIERRPDRKADFDTPSAGSCEDGGMAAGQTEIASNINDQK
ncbi:hypothetical protein [Nonomuraea sp. NPDC049141]|uniref:hypothetical protein n=1 Tax=Nonomuraea sp. NPDC049141 TaxID=3155500 RepID=UPI0033D0685E